MTSRSEGGDPVSRWAGRNGLDFAADPEPATVQEVIHRYRNLAISMDFQSVLRRQQTDAEIAWMICRSKKDNRDAIRDASVLTIAYGLSLQQLGYLQEAMSCLAQLLGKLGLQPDGSGLTRVHHALGVETGDNALSLLFRLHPSALGTEECTRNLQNALGLLRTRKQKAKFYWRLQLGNVLIGKNVDVGDFQQQYSEFTGEDRITAAGNATNIPLSQAIARALEQRPDRCAKYWDDVLYWSDLASRAVQTTLFNSNPGHLITHTRLSALRESVYYKWRVALLRGKHDQMIDLARLWCDLEELRHDAHIRSTADGFREIDQVNAALFRNEAPRIASMASPCPIGEENGPLSREERLRKLTDQVNNI